MAGIIALFLITLVGQSTAQRDDSSQLKLWEAEGDTLMSQEKFSGAIKSYSKVIEATGLKDKNAYNTLYKRAVCYYYTEGKEELALQDVDRFIEEFPYVPQSHILRALLYRIKEDADGQLNDLDIAIGFQPSNAGLLKWRAGLLLDKEKFEEAKQDAQNAILFEDDLEVETYLAFAHFNLNNPDSALFAINKAIELDYSYLPSYLYAGSFCIQKDEYQLGLTYLNLGLRVDPENPALLFYKGVALVEMERKDEGCRFLNKAFYTGYDDASDYIKQYCYSSEEN
jgi:tetratricopeptide (TPR) repeat protein